METHFGILVWEIPWTEESGGPWGHNESDTAERPNTHTHTHTHKLSTVPSVYHHIRSLGILKFYNYYFSNH